MVDQSLQSCTSLLLLRRDWHQQTELLTIRDNLIPDFNLVTRLVGECIEGRWVVGWMMNISISQFA